VHVQLNQRLIPDALEAVDLAGLDHQDVSRARLELLSIHHIAAPALSQELDLVVRVAMRTGTPAGQSPEQEHGDVDIALVRSHELVRAALEGEILLANPIYARALLELVPSIHQGNVRMPQVTDNETGIPRKRW
jgi:hypothetical protein